MLSEGEQRKCVEMASAFREKKLTPDIQCAYVDSVDHCMQKIQVRSPGHLRGLFRANAQK